MGAGEKREEMILYSKDNSGRSSYNPDDLRIMLVIHGKFTLSN